MIRGDFAAEVLGLREQGMTWPQVSKATGRPQRTCQRAIGVGQPAKRCAEHGCAEPALRSGRYCDSHARQKMRFGPGRGVRQIEVMRIMRRKGFASSEELRSMTGMNSDSLGQVLGRLVRLGMLERPMMGHYRIPRYVDDTDA